MGPPRKLEALPRPIGRSLALHLTSAQRISRWCKTVPTRVLAAVVLGVEWLTGVPGDESASLRMVQKRMLTPEAMHLLDHNRRGIPGHASELMRQGVPRDVAATLAMIAA